MGKSRRKTLSTLHQTVIVCVLIAGAAGLPVALAQLPSRLERADLKTLEEAFVKLAEEVRPSVVAIKTFLVADAESHRGHRVRVRVNQGSGFIIDAKGYIATNRHVLDEANAFDVVLYNGMVHEATVVQSDPRRDLAVLRIEAADLTPVQWGDASDVRVNQWAFAAGNPFGLANARGGPSITYGTVSALGRNMTRLFDVDQRVHYYGNLIETSAAINPGNSGGPLFNIDGKVIGIVTAIATSTGVTEGVGFAIPLNKDTRHVLDTLKAGRPVRYGFLGVSVTDVELPALGRLFGRLARRGARISAIDPPDAPAAKAGLKPGDIVIKVDGVTVEDMDHLVRLVGFTPVGSTIEITYLRHQVQRKTKVTLGDRYELLGLVEEK